MYAYFLLCCVNCNLVSPVEVLFFFVVRGTLCWNLTEHLVFVHPHMPISESWCLSQALYEQDWGKGSGFFTSHIECLNWVLKSKFCASQALLLEVTATRVFFTSAKTFLVFVNFQVNLTLFLLRLPSISTLWLSRMRITDLFIFYE